MKPSDVVPQFTDERLAELARRILRIRFDALLEHRPEKGDGPWGLGTRVYERMIHQLERAGVYELDWLIVRLEGLFVSLKVNGYPIRIYSGEPEKPKPNVCAAGERDIKETPVTPELLTDPTSGDWFWTLAVETVEGGVPIGAYVQQVSLAGETRNRCMISVDLDAIKAEVAIEASAALAALTAPTTPLAKPAVEVEKATVRAKGTRRRAEGE